VLDICVSMGFSMSFVRILIPIALCMGELLE
jgi:hypothetical protein